MTPGPKVPTRLPTVPYRYARGLPRSCRLRRRATAVLPGDCRSSGHSRLARAVPASPPEIRRSTTWKRRPLTSSRFDPHEAVLRRRMPGEQGQVEGVEHVLHPFDLRRPTFDHDAPRLAASASYPSTSKATAVPSTAAASLVPSAVRNTTFPCSTTKFTGKDVRVVADRHRQATDFDDRSSSSTGWLRDGDAETICLHTSTVHRRGLRR